MSTSDRSLSDSLSAASALDDPVRRALYDFVSRSTEPVSRDTAASALSLARSTTAFHLDRLASEGLLEIEFRRLSGRTGPGAGRPSKLYRRANTELLLSVPVRHYDLAGDLMAEAIGESSESGEAVLTTLGRVAARAGRRLGAAADSLEQALEQNGFEPRDEGCNGIVLGNCPFHRLAQSHMNVVCGLNLELITGVAEGSNDTSHTITLDPGAGQCCIRALPRIAEPEGTDERAGGPSHPPT